MAKLKNEKTLLKTGYATAVTAAASDHRVIEVCAKVSDGIHKALAGGDTATESAKSLIIAALGAAGLQHDESQEADTARMAIAGSIPYSDDKKLTQRADKLRLAIECAPFTAAALAELDKHGVTGTETNNWRGDGVLRVIRTARLTTLADGKPWNMAAALAAVRPYAVERASELATKRGMGSADKIIAHLAKDRLFNGQTGDNAAKVERIYALIRELPPVGDAVLSLNSLLKAVEKQQEAFKTLTPQQQKAATKLLVSKLTG